MSRFFPTLFVLFLSSPAWPQSDPVETCRSLYGADAGAHIACLETAVQALIEGQSDGRDADVPDDAPAATPEMDASAASALGAEQVRAVSGASEDEPDEARVRIVSATYDASGLGLFRMADGQVWRETTVYAERRRLEPEREYDARITRSILGGYRLHVDGVRHMKTVRRVE